MAGWGARRGASNVNWFYNNFSLITNSYNTGRRAGSLACSPNPNPLPLKRRHHAVDENGSQTRLLPVR